MYCIENNKIDDYLPKYKVGVEVDECDHKDRDPNYEQSRQLMIEHHGIIVIRINPDDLNFDMNRLINQIYTHIIKTAKKQTEEKKKRIKELKDEIKKIKELEDEQKERKK